VPASPPLIRYLREASRLRHAIMLSELDEAFADAGGHVHYILDTNVIRMFMAPAGHIDQLGMFSSWLDRETLTATATLTSEFLLSRDLPGQRGESATLSPAHFEEVIGLADRAKDALDALPTQEIDQAVRAIQRSRDQLNALAKDIRDPNLDTRRKFAALTTVLPNELAKLVQGPFEELMQLKRALVSDSIYRVDGMPWFHASTLQPDTKDELNWYRRIRAARHEIEGAQSQEKTINEMRDARTISLITRLTSEYAGDADEQHRFLFVTADSAIRLAVETFVLEHQTEEGDCPLAVFIRHPREFVPLLNLGNISGDDELRSIFFTLKATLDELLTGLAAPYSTSGVYIEPSDEEIEGSLAHSGADVESAASEKLDELRRQWCLACRAALSLGVGLMRGRDEALFGAIAEVITAQDLKLHIKEHIVDTLDELLRDHAGLNVLGLLSAVRRFDSRKESDGIPAASRVLRVPLHLIDASLFSEFIGHKKFNDYLLHIARGGDLHELADHLASRGRDPIASLFLACICLAIGLWDAAKDFAKRALPMVSTQRNSEALGTARYVFAVSHRMALCSSADVDATVKVLEESIATHSRRKERLFELRAMSELAAVKLAAVEQTLYYMSLAESGEEGMLVSKKDIPRYLTYVARTLETIIYSLENDFPERNDLSFFILQAFANAAAFSIITRVHPKYKQARSHLNLSDAQIIMGLDTAMKSAGTASPIIRVYLEVLRATSASSQADIKTLRQSALRELAEVRIMSLVLPRMDIEVAEFLAERLPPLSSQ